MRGCRGGGGAFIEKDFCFIQDQMNTSHAWNSLPRRGLAVLSEDSREEESDREIYDNNRGRGSELSRLVEKAKQRALLEPENEPRISPRTRKIIKILAFIVVFLLSIFLFYRCQPFLFPPHQASKRTTTYFSPPLEKEPLLSTRIACSNYTLLGHSSDGSYFYSLEAKISKFWNETKPEFGFYQAFSATGKRVGSSTFWKENDDKNDEKLIWKIQENRTLESEEMIEKYELTFFLQSDSSSLYSKKILILHCPESTVRKVVEDTEHQEALQRHQIDDRLVQCFVYVLSFVLGLMASRWLPLLS